MAATGTIEKVRREVHPDEYEVIAAAIGTPERRTIAIIEHPERMAA